MAKALGYDSRRAKNIADTSPARPAFERRKDVLLLWFKSLVNRIILRKTLLLDEWLAS